MCEIHLRRISIDQIGVNSQNNEGKCYETLLQWGGCSHLLGWLDVRNKRELFRNCQFSAHWYISSLPSLSGYRKQDEIRGLVLEIVCSKKETGNLHKRESSKSSLHDLQGESLRPHLYLLKICMACVLIA